MPTTPRRTLLACIGAMALVVVLSSCCGQPPAAACTPPNRPDLPASDAIIGQLQSVREDMGRGVYDKHYRASPIIDVHTHGFNARDLPLRGIVLGKRTGALQCVPDSVVVAVADLVTAASPKAGEQAWGGSVASASDEAIGHLSPAEQEAVRSDEGYQAVRKILGEARDLANAHEQAWDAELAADELLTPAEKKALDLYGVLGAIRFLWNVTRDHESAYRRYTRAFALQDRETIMVMQMMDLAPVYDQLEREPRVMAYPTHQLDAAESLGEKLGGRVLHFVAYNPYRDHWAKGDPGHDAGLQIVKDAVERRGFYGVKVYPPSGYRPSANQRLDPPATRPSPAPRRQWEARYTDESGSRIEPGEFDRRLYALLDYCVVNDIPVFTHSSTGEFEAQPCYGIDMADPKFWEAYLADTSGSVDRSRLRLCFGHAGSSGFWFGKRAFEEWGETVHRLCVTYPNVYCEIGVHDEITDPNRRAYFASKLEELFAAGEGAFPFESKIMYGTDWFMPISSSAIDYRESYESVFLWGSLRKHYHRFFRLNAAAFLNVDIESARGRIDPEIMRPLISAKNWKPEE